MSKYGATTAHRFLQLPNEVLGRYNLWDSHTTARLLEPIIRELRDHDQWDYYEREVEPLQRAVIAMQRRGILCDREAKARARRRIRQELRETDRALCEAQGLSRFNPNSDTQVGKWLFESRDAGGLGLRPTKRTEKRGAPSVDQDALTRILRDLRKMDEHAKVHLHNLFHRSRLQTLWERYTDFPIGPDGRVRPTVKMYGTKTQRFSYSEPPLHGWPPELRYLFVASPGAIFLVPDFSQLEARLLAYLSKDRVAIEAFERGDDIHQANVFDLFGWDGDKWAALDPAGQEAARVFAKTFFFRMNYGGTMASGDRKLYCSCPRCADKMPPVVDLRPSEVVAAEQRWHHAHPAVEKMHQQIAEQVRRHHYYEPILGGRRYISKPWGKDLERELRNLPMQTGGAQLINRAQRRLHHELRAPILLQHHDAFVLEVPDRPASRVDQWAADVRGVMESPVPELGGVTFPVDLKVGENWGRYHPTDNERGLRGFGE